jgi:hypothetical protein
LRHRDREAHRETKRHTAARECTRQESNLLTLTLLVLPEKCCSYSYRYKYVCKYMSAVQHSTANRREREREGYLDTHAVDPGGQRGVDHEVYGVLALVGVEVVDERGVVDHQGAWGGHRRAEETEKRRHSKRRQQERRDSKRGQGQ